MINPPWFTGPVETMAFNAWACNESRLDSLADDIAKQYLATGQTNFTVDDVTPEEAEEIQRRVSKRICGY